MNNPKIILNGKSIDTKEVPKGSSSKWTPQRQKNNVQLNQLSFRIQPSMGGGNPKSLVRKIREGSEWAEGTDCGKSEILNLNTGWFFFTGTPPKSSKYRKVNLG